MAEVATSEQVTIIGREGLIIPVPDTNIKRTYQLLTFFRNLWKTNGLEFGSTDPYGNPVFNKAYGAELVLPPSANKPLTVVRGSYVPRDKQEIEHELIVNRARGSDNWGQLKRGTKGHEKHGVYEPPEQLGAFVPVIEVLETHDQDYDPEVYWHAQPIREGDYRLDWSDFSKKDDWRLKAERERDAFNSALKTILDQTVEFLT